MVPKGADNEIEGANVMGNLADNMDDDERMEIIMNDLEMGCMVSTDLFVLSGDVLNHLLCFFGKRNQYL